MFTTELRKHIGQMATALGVVNVEHDQWQVFVSTETQLPQLVGYLPHAKGSRLMPVLNLPDQIWKEIVSQCEAIKGDTVLPPIPIYIPIEASEDDEEEEDDAS